MNSPVISIMQEDVLEKTTGIVFTISGNGNIMNYQAGKWAAFPLVRKCKTGKNILDIIPPSKWSLFRESVSMLNNGHKEVYFKFPLVCNKEKYWFRARIKAANDESFIVAIIKMKDNRKKNVYPEYSNILRQ
jgi:hypothetical protein